MTLFVENTSSFLSGRFDLLYSVILKLICNRLNAFLRSVVGSYKYLSANFTIAVGVCSRNKFKMFLSNLLD